MISLKSTYLKRDINKWSFYTLAIVLFVSVPILIIFYKLFSGPGESWQHIVDYVLVDYTINTLWLIIGCLIFTLIFGVYSAWIVSRYQLPFQKILEWMLILPLAIPSYITAYAYAGFFDYGGSLELLLRSFGLTINKIDILNIYGLIMVLSLSLFPYVYVSARAVFLYQSNRIIEASKLLGVSELKTFFKVVLPIARPAIVAGVFLVLMEVLNDYGAAKYFGIPTFTTGIFRTWFSLEEPLTAVYLSAILLVFVFMLILLERLQRGDKKFSNATKSDVPLPKRDTSKSFKLVLTFLVSIPIILGFIIPFFQLIYWSTLTFSSTFTLPLVFIVFQSFLVAFTSSILTVFFALMILYFPTWNRIKLFKNSSKIATLGYAIPGAVIALGVMIPTLFFDKWFINVVKQVANIEIGLLINSSIAILVYAYIIRFLAVAFNPIAASQTKINKSLFESSKLLGKSNFTTFFKIEFPLLKTAIYSAIILVFVDVMKELPLTLILKPYHINTLAVKAYEYASDEQIMEVSVPSLLIITTGIIPIIMLNKLILRAK